MIGVVDYGVGNVQAFLNVYRRLNIPAISLRTPDEFFGVDHIILPGVGSFDWAMARLNVSGMRDVLDRAVLQMRQPVLGVCVGMQMLARGSDEGQLAGLSWIPAWVRRFDEQSFRQKTHLPHMGWNDAAPCAVDGLFRGMSTPRFYFLHSYFFLPDNPDHVLATTEYSSKFASAVRAGHIFGTQFHPEKSHHWGVQLLKNFAEV